MNPEVDAAFKEMYKTMEDFKAHYADIQRHLEGLGLKKAKSKVMEESVTISKEVYQTLINGLTQYANFERELGNLLDKFHETDQYPDEEAKVFQTVGEVSDHFVAIIDKEDE